MEQLSPLPHEKELPAPNEKLLRSPTFWERQGKTAKWLAIGSIIFFLFFFTIALLLKSQTPIIIPTQPTQPQLSTIPMTISTSPDPTANWQTYKNEKYGFEFQYPENLQLEVTELSTSCPGCADIYKFKTSNIQITVGGSMTWDTAKNQLMEGIDGKNVDIAKYNIGGTGRIGKATKFSRFPQFEGQEVKELITMYEDGIIFDFFATKTEEKIFDQILSTFKFTDQNHTVISPSSPMADLSFFNLLASQDTNIKWGAIKPEKGYSIPQNGSSIQVDGYSREGTLVSNNVEGGTSMADEVKLVAMGWKADNDLNADGVFGQGWGYRRTLNGKSQILQFSSANITWRDEVQKAQIDPNYDPATFKPTCPCINSYYVFLSNPF